MRATRGRRLQREQEPDGRQEVNDPARLREGACDDAITQQVPEIPQAVPCPCGGDEQDPSGAIEVHRGERDNEQRGEGHRLEDGLAGPPGQYREYGAHDREDCGEGEGVHRVVVEDKERCGETGEQPLPRKAVAARPSTDPSLRDFCHSAVTGTLMLTICT